MREQPNGGADPDEVFRSRRDIRGGIACFTGTRVGVSQLLGYLRDGYTINDFLRDFPTVTKDQVQRAIERIEHEYVGDIERKCAPEHDPGPDRTADDGEQGSEGRDREGGRAGRVAIEVGDTARPEGGGRARRTSERFTVG